MKSLLRFAAPSIAVLPFFASCAARDGEPKTGRESAHAADTELNFVALFDGETLNGWTSARSSVEGDWGPFSVNEDEGAIHVYAGQEDGSRQQSDCLVSVDEYSHFVLRLEYKWMENRFRPRANWDRDAGLLFHVHGDLSRVWPLSLEMQIGESKGDKVDGKASEGRFHTGDLFVLGRELRTDTPRDENYYKMGAEKETGKAVQTRLGVEKPRGEWNQLEIRVEGSEKATFLLNGAVVLETFNFTQKNANGEQLPLTKGRIGLQAEWAELMYRNILIHKIAPR